MRFRGSRTAIATLALLGTIACADARANVEGSFERTLKVTGPVDLQISTGSGRISIRPGGSDVVRVYAQIRANDGFWGGASAEEKVRYIESNPPIEQAGNVIRIGRIDDSRYRNNVSISYELIVPSETRLDSKTGSGSQTVAGIRGPATVSSGSGHLEINDIGDRVSARTGSGGINLDGANGSVDLSTGSGSIRAMRIGGSFKGSTGSGRITVEQSAPGDVDVQTGSGSIEASGIRGAFRARTGSGGITAGGSPAGDWTVHAGSGGVTIRLESGCAFDLYARTNSGHVTVDQPLTVQGAISRKEIRGKVRNGGPLLEITTGSGNITVQ